MRALSGKSLSKLKSLPALVRALKAEKRKGRKIVFTNGCFDILHVGHVRYLETARRLGDVLVVALNTDASVRKLKGPSRPIHAQKDRAEVLSALESVTYTTFFSEPTPLKVIQALKPDYLVKGGDWKKDQIVGSAFVESYGGRVRSLPFVNGFSTTGIVEKIQKI